MQRAHSCHAKLPIATVVCPHYLMIWTAIGPPGILPLESTTPMPIITTEREPEYGGTLVKVNGITLRGFTEMTDAAQIADFVKRCEIHADELARLAQLQRERIAWNMANENAPTKQKRHPVFYALERLLNQLQKEAGIIDS